MLLFVELIKVYSEYSMKREVENKTKPKILSRRKEGKTNAYKDIQLYTTCTSLRIFMSSRDTEEEKIYRINPPTKQELK